MEKKGTTLATRRTAQARSKADGYRDVAPSNIWTFLFCGYIRRNGIPAALLANKKSSLSLYLKTISSLRMLLLWVVRFTTNHTLLE